MKTLILQLAGYHLWANQLLADAISLLPEEKLQQPVVSSFPSLYATVLHLWDAESIWWQRIKLSEKVIMPSEGFEGSWKELSQQWLQQSRQWQEWISSSHERMLEHEFIYSNSRKEKFKQPVSQMLVHLFNHGTYHRGQLVTILRQLGVEKVPQTDFIVWSRKKG